MDILPFVFKLWHQSGRIKKIIADGKPALDSLRAVWPEAAPLLRDWIKITDKLLTLLAPTFNEAKKAWDKIEPDATALMNIVAPDLLEQWGKEPELPFMSVRWMQNFLNEEGYEPKLKLDGNWGASTDKAVEWYQKKTGLKVDGRVGRETLTAMLSAAKAKNDS